MLETVSCLALISLRSPLREMRRRSAARLRPEAFCVRGTLVFSWFRLGQSLHKGAKLIAAIGVAFEHVEGRGARGKKDNLAGPGYCVGAFNGIGQAVGDVGSRRAAPRPSNALGHFADQDCRFNLFFYQRSKGIEREPFVLAAGDENDRFGLRAQRL